MSISNVALFSHRVTIMPIRLKDLSTLCRRFCWSIGCYSYVSGEKKEPKPKLFGPDIFGWGGGLPRKWVGAKKSSVWPSKPGKSNFFAGISRDFAGISRRCPKSLRKKVCVQCSSRNVVAMPSKLSFWCSKFLLGL